jgi:signal transduction histidine kinase
LRLRELETSRPRIVQAADEARRRIERDLHDGAQQQFVAVAATGNARCLLAVASDDAARLLRAAHADLREAIAELQCLTVVC